MMFQVELDELYPMVRSDFKNLLLYYRKYSEYRPEPLLEIWWHYWIELVELYLELDWNIVTMFLGESGLELLEKNVV